MIEFFMPVMRDESARTILKQLDGQGINSFHVIDNSGTFEYPCDLHYKELVLTSPRKNIGTNAAWNYAFDSKADYIGLVGDDYEVPPNLISLFLEAFEKYPTAGAITATITNTLPLNEFNPGSISGKRITGKGNMGVVLFRGEILRQIPKIPPEFFIFCGDNWIGYWLSRMAAPLILVNVFVGHVHKTDLKDKIGYKGIIVKEKSIYREWKAGKRTLGGFDYTL